MSGLALLGEGDLEAHPRFVVDVAARVEAAERRVEPRSRSGVIL